MPGHPRSYTACLKKQHVRMRKTSAEAICLYRREGSQTLARAPPRGKS